MFEEYEDIDKIRECIIEFFASKEMKDALEQVQTEDEKLHYMIIDIVYLAKKNRVRIIDVETLIMGGEDLLPEEPQDFALTQGSVPTEGKGGPAKKDDKKKKTAQELREEEIEKKKMEEEENRN